jgi:hypothetical protein
LKFTIAYYLLLLYVTIILKPLLPILSDVYSHTFAEVIHITTVHAKYGSNHLAYDLAKADSDDNSKDQTTPKSDDPFPFHVFADYSDMNLIIKKDTASYCLFKQYTLPSVCILKHTPPPRLV